MSKQTPTYYWEENGWHMVIGLEIHVQLLCKSKLFSSSPATYNPNPNEHINEIDLAHPGVMIRTNKQAIEHAIKFGLAIDNLPDKPESNIAKHSRFARKHYFYPDLAKGYQISQFDQPIITSGSLPIRISETETFDCVFTRAHLEEDAGKLIHTNKGSAVDYNRAGTPLIEIVTEPCMSTPTQAVSAAKAIHQLVRWLGICDGNMQEGSFRVDINISLQPNKKEDHPTGTRCEIKNLNSFRFAEQAIIYEATRQAHILESGKQIIQQTRLFNPDKAVTYAMRDKEDAHDYRYFPEPDLNPIIIKDDTMQQAAEQLGTLPHELREEWLSKYNLRLDDLNLLLSERKIAELLQETLTVIDSSKRKNSAKILSNLIISEIAPHYGNLDLIATLPTPAELSDLVTALEQNTISSTSAKKVIKILCQDTQSKSVAEIIEENNLAQLSDNKGLEEIVQTIIDENPVQAEQYRQGKDKVIGFLIGKAMGKSKGKANPQQLSQLFNKKLR